MAKKVKKNKKIKTTKRLNVLITEHSALKRKIAIETFTDNGFRKLPGKGTYKDEAGEYILLKKAKVTVMIKW